MCSICGRQGHSAYNCPYRGKSVVLLLLICACAVMLAGCASTPVPPSALTAPPAWMMAAPEPLPDTKAGDDLVKQHIALRAQAKRQASRLRALQGYVKTLRGET